MTMECKKALGTYVIPSEQEEQCLVWAMAGRRLPWMPSILCMEWDQRLVLTWIAFDALPLLSDMLLVPKIRNVVDSDDGEKSKRLILLSMAIKDKGIAQEGSLQDKPSLFQPHQHGLLVCQ